MHVKTIEGGEDLDKDKEQVMEPVRKSGKQFDKEQVIKSIKKSEVFGEKDKPLSCWPSQEELRAKSEQTLQQLRIAKIEWHVTKRNAIESLRFTLSDGSVSQQLGKQCNLTKSFEFPKERPIKRIRMKVNQAGGSSFINRVEFLDA